MEKDLTEQEVQQAEQAQQLDLTRPLTDAEKEALERVKAKVLKEVQKLKPKTKK